MFLVKSRSLLMLRNICCFSWGRKKQKNNPGFLHPPTEPSSLSFGPHHPPMPARIKPMRAEWPVTTRDLLHPTCPGKIPKNLCGSIASIVHFLQVKRSSLLLKSHQFCCINPYFFPQIPPIVLGSPHFFPNFWLNCPAKNRNFTRTPSGFFRLSLCDLANADLKRPCEQRNGGGQRKGEMLVREFFIWGIISS